MDKTHLKQKKAFKSWRKAMGLSYSMFTRKVNNYHGHDVLRKETVVNSWGGKGNMPRASFREAIRAVFSDCPLGAK